MPTSYTYDDLILAVAQEALADKDFVDVTATSAGTTTTAVIAGLAFGTSGATTTKFHDEWVYWRRTRGTATAGGASTITLESAHDYETDALTGMTIRITAGTSIGDSRTIASNTNADPSVVTVSAAWTATPTTSSVYEITPYSSTIAECVRTSKALSTGSFAVASGTITVAPAFGLATEAAQIFIHSDLLLCGGLHPNQIRNSINRILRNMRYPAYLPVGMIPDGDMEDSYTVGTSASFTEWYRNNAAVAASKSSTSYPFPFGRQYMDVTSSAADEYGIQCASIAVDPDESLYVAVMVQKTPTATETGDFDVILYDVTNSTVLKTVNVTGQQPCIVYFQQALASTTEEVAVQALSSSTTASNFRVGPVFLWSGQRSRYAADTSSLERGTDVKGAFTLHLGQSLETDVYHIGALEETQFGVERDDRANLINIVIPTSPYPTLIKGERRYVELAADTDTTYAERDMVVQGAMYHVEMARAAALFAGNPQLASWHRGRAREYAKTYSSMLEGTGISLVEPMRVPQARTAVRLA